MDINGLLKAEQVCIKEGVYYSRTIFLNLEKEYIKYMYEQKLTVDGVKKNVVTIVYNEQYAIPMMEYEYDEDGKPLSEGTTPTCVLLVDTDMYQINEYLKVKDIARKGFNLIN